MTSEKKTMSLTGQIMIAMGAGALFGILLNQFSEVPWINEYLVLGLLHVVGAMFIAALVMLVVPLVFVSLVVGVTSMGNIASLGRMSIKALALYLFTTAVAVSIALALAVTVTPGEGVEVSIKAAEFEVKEAPALTQLLIDMVPTNPVQAMAQGNMLQIIVFSMLFGVAVTLAGEKGTHVVNLFNDLNAAIMHMVDIVMRLAPYGVFALIGKAFATQGLDLIVPLIAYFLTFTVAITLHGLGTYPLLVRVLAGLNPVTFLRKMRDPATFAFSTASSGATIPITMRTLEAKMGVKNSVASFTVPLGAPSTWTAPPSCRGWRLSSSPMSMGWTWPSRTT
jgi:DAACS family dicarboxylate/amino acid:cation (Na+ or H+) symporter